MTSKLEQEFYDTFGIEKQKYYACQNENYKDVFEVRHPEITDRILLELICLILKVSRSGDYGFSSCTVKNINDLKKIILEDYILYSSKEKIFKEQVKALFESEE